jgi:hypothetical protein
MAARILAFVAAIAMVGGALAYRASQHSGGGGTGSSIGPVFCAQELGSACAAVSRATVDLAGAAADQMTSGGRVGAWITPGPWPAMVDEARRLDASPKLFGTSQTLATTPLVAIVRKGQLPLACTPEVTWKCLAEASQDRRLRMGAPPPDRAEGLFVRAALLGGILGTEDFAINDLNDQPDAVQQFGNVNDRLREARSFGATSVDAFVAQKVAAQLFLSTGVDARDASHSADFEVLIPTPTVTILAAYTPAKRGRASIDTAKVTKALTAAGWKAGPVAGGGGLPSPGVLLALRERLIN